MTRRREAKGAAWGFNDDESAHGWVVVMNRLAILGAGGHGRVVADCAACAGWRVIHVFDDGPSNPDPGPWPPRGTSEALMSRLSEFDGVVVGIGANEARWRWQKRLLEAGAVLPALVHPKACVSTFVEIGAGSVVLAGAIVNVGAYLGSAVIVNSGATVDHDCHLGNGVHVSPGANLAGGVRVDDLAWIGIGATVKEGMIIGRNAKVGAGAAVIRPVSHDQTVVGVPALEISGSSDA